MDIDIIPAHNYKTVLNNLMQFYLYDFSEFIEYDVEDTGLFKPYPGLEDYWKLGSGKLPYLLKQNEHYTGFVLLETKGSGRKHYSVAEFFIMKKYRRKGIATAVAKQLLTAYKGKWEIRQRENNLPAQQFWIKLISEFTKGNFSDRFEVGRRVQSFESYCNFDTIKRFNRQSTGKSSA